MVKQMKNKVCKICNKPILNDEVGLKLNYQIMDSDLSKEIWLHKKCEISIRLKSIKKDGDVS